MKLVMDVHHESEGFQAAAVGFEAWDAREAERTWTARLPSVEKAVRGQLDLRALPCLLQLLHQHALAPELIVLDGLVHLDEQETPALGHHLFHALGGRVPVIGIASSGASGFSGQYEVVREEEARPVIVTSIGLDLGAAKARVRAMHGRKRLPTLVKLATRLAKASEG